jgi:ATP-dependent Lon protease
MTDTMTLPVLPLVDDVVLPGMVAPITLDGEAQAAVDAARSAGERKLALVPRVNGA